MFVIIFNRDKTPREWDIVGPFDNQVEAGNYAKADYCKTQRLWIVHPVNSI